MNDAPLASVCTSMPEAMKCSLAERFAACFHSDPLQHRNTASDPLEMPYETLHFSWYNRHCTRVSSHSPRRCSRCSLIFTKGQDAPTDTPPLMMRRAGRSRTNHAQFLPYTSKDMADNSMVYESLKNLLDDVFMWIDQKVAYSYTWNGLC